MVAYAAVGCSHLQVLRWLPLLLLPACSASIPRSATELTTSELPIRKARCDGEPTLRPLLVDWPATDRAALETRLRRGLVVVRYTGCELHVLRSCTAKHGYAYQGITRKQDRVMIRNTDELYANLPLTAVKLETKLAQTGEMSVDMSIVGGFEAAQAPRHLGMLEGACGRATHVVVAAQIGAFEFRTGQKATAGASVEVAAIAGGGARRTASSELLSTDGNARSCDRARSADKAPPEGCGALLRIELSTLGAAPPPALTEAPKLTPTPPQPGPVCPPGARIRDGACVANCPAGTRYRGGECVAECPQGTYYSGGRCEAICQGGSRWDGSRCVAAAPTPPPPVLTAQPPTQTPTPSAAMVAPTPTAGADACTTLCQLAFRCEAGPQALAMMPPQMVQLQMQQCQLQCGLLVQGGYGAVLQRCVQGRPTCESLAQCITGADADSVFDW